MTENRKNSNIPNKIAKLSITMLMTLALTLTQFVSISAEETITEGEVIEEGSLTIDPNHHTGDEEEIVTFELEEDPIPEEDEIIETEEDINENEILEEEQLDEEGEPEIQMFSAAAYSLMEPAASPAAPNKILGFVTAPKDETVNVYTSATSNSTLTYISNQPSYNGDAAILEETNTRYKIKVAGVVGWVNKNISNMKVYNTADVKSISHYQVNAEGDLIHYLSKGPHQEGYSALNNGKAPSYLVKNKQYYSYDGHFFYVNKDTMINDYRKDSYNNALNIGKPFYNYYQFLPYRTQTAITPELLDNYIKDVKGYTELITGETNVGIKENQSQLTGAGSIALTQASKYGANGMLSFSTGVHESAWGRSYIAANRNNLFGHAAYDSYPGAANKYENIATAFKAHNTRFLNWSYLDFDSWLFNGGFLGNKESGINVRYASDAYWGEKIASHYLVMDRYFGSPDYNSYKIGAKTSALPVEIKKEPFIEAETITNKKETKPYKAILKQKNHTVVILNQVEGESVAGSTVWYQISIDSLVESSTRDLLYIGPTVNGDREHRETGYDFAKSYGYVHSSELTVTDYDGSNSGRQPVAPPVITPPKPVFKKGDVDGNGTVQLKDLAMLQGHLLKVNLLTGDNLMRADVDGNGTVQLKDLAMIQGHLLRVNLLD